MRARFGEQGDRAEPEGIHQLYKSRRRQLLLTARVRGRHRAGDKGFSEGDRARSAVGRGATLARHCLTPSQPQCRSPEGIPEVARTQTSPSVGQSAARQDAGAMNRRRLALGASIVLVTLLGYFEFPGHTYLQSDTQVYVPMMERLRDPSLFTRDIMVLRTHLTYTAYDETTLALVRISGMRLETVLVAEQLVFRALGVTGLLLIAEDK